MEYVNSIMGFVDAERFVVLVFGFALLTVLLWYFSLLQKDNRLEDMLEEVNKVVDIYDCGKISKRFLEQVISSLEASGKTLEGIDVEDIIEEAILINPNLKVPSQIKDFTQ
jgi:hypothetical protein